MRRAESPVVESTPRRTATRFQALDGVELGAVWHLPTTASACKHVTVIACGAGIASVYYRNLAGYLARQGLPVLTFDYRGIGLSRDAGRDARTADVLTWGHHDLGGALTYARACFPDAELAVVTHSFAAAILGAAPMASDVSRAVFLGPHTGYWGDYRKRWRVPLYITWHVLMPLVTHGVGYFPGRRLGLGIDLPRGVALEWAGRRRSALAATVRRRPKWRAALADYDRVRAETLVISVIDDAFAPPVAARNLVALYPRLRPHFVEATPSAVGFRRVGHMGFLRRTTGPCFWPSVSAWILHNDISHAKVSGDGPARSEYLSKSALDADPNVATANPGH